MLALVASAAILVQDAGSSPPVGSGRLAAVAAPGTTATASVARGDKVVCRKEQETGSLLGGHKTCHTQAQWDQMAQDARDTTNAVTLMGNHRNGGGGG